jgi:hypothetical protein
VLPDLVNLVKKVFCITFVSKSVKVGHNDHEYNDHEFNDHRYNDHGYNDHGYNDHVWSRL